MNAQRDLSFGAIPSALSHLSIKSTLVSIVPFPIAEFKPGLMPGQFDIPASDCITPTFTVIGESQYFVYIDESRGNLRVGCPSYDVAAAIISDYNVAQLAVNIGCHPGFFWVLGEWDWERFQRDPQLMMRLEEIRAIQERWFIELVTLADDDWEKTRAHWAISDTQRAACRFLDPTNKAERPWILMKPSERPADVTIPMQACPCCVQEVPAGAVLCHYCKYILDQVKYASMKFAAPQPNPSEIARLALQSQPGATS